MRESKSNCLQSARRSHLGSIMAQHFEELSVLYEQRVGIEPDGEFNWHASEKAESRSQTHLKALVNEGDYARRTSLTYAREGLGELSATLQYLVAVEDWNSVLREIDAVSVRSLQAIEAVVDALVHTESEAHVSELKRVIHSLNPTRISIAALVLGHLRANCSGELISAAQLERQGCGVHLLWAMGRCGKSELSDLTASYIDADDCSLATVASIANARITGAVSSCVKSYIANDTNWPLTVLALSSENGMGNEITQCARQNPSVSTIRSLGVYGASESLIYLIECLSEEELAADAAEALRLVTGAPLYEEVWISDTLHPAELFPEEREIYKQKGVLPGRADGTSFGWSCNRTSRCPEQWIKWINKHAEHFRFGNRYRLGQPISPQQTTFTLIEQKSPSWAREAAQEELVIRYRCPVPFETSWRVSKQKQNLSHIEHWLNTSR